jgi:hypothetical protein
MAEAPSHPLPFPLPMLPSIHQIVQTGSNDISNVGNGSGGHGISALPCSGPAQAEQKNWQIYEFLICNVTLHTCLLHGEITHNSCIALRMFLCCQKTCSNRKYFGNRKEEKKKQQCVSD